MNYNKTIIFSIVAVIAALGVFTVLSRSRLADNSSVNLADLRANADSLAAEETEFDFGAISMSRGKVSHAFKIRNTGSGPIEIEKLYTSCMCTVAFFTQDSKRVGPFGMPGHGFVPPLRRTLVSGEEVIIEAIFDPAAHGPSGIGRIERVVYLEDENGVALQLGIRAMVEP
ncbi:MAG: hypothetical protein A3I24_02085 [Candidatus Harrisonbacteria bacterium RIFCSPLOWO2_02_FULL_41_13b]|uniref:DUF1573 domain-containing protein n=1 Tax=Candidatus Harrisonbacteria bacterium RIFCSPLOWO2_02_FULL_41_13b TaxID=1798409 RepID=A0A1G1ZTP0_9BACT|nr:MAG: hypothetical protein A3J53_00940 [Candidatus Harrisonbacteria bacterium RIFCSPHIGHO2_02_FULL_40_20]OGY67934.1 MAG: hypothetical protein A3I24_02085 [Candidatus Harrisonbacteria bacterium RIFCSPLOWO2_02_FULL_41_13b]